MEAGVKQDVVYLPASRRVDPGGLHRRDQRGGSQVTTFRVLLSLIVRRSLAFVILTS
jgi:hypothetical protein